MTSAAMKARDLRSRGYYCVAEWRSHSMANEWVILLRERHGRGWRVLRVASAPTKAKAWGAAAAWDAARNGGAS